MDSLYTKSLDIIKQGQSESGAYIACPNFPTYHYCWLRDGSYIAHAMDTAAEYASAEAFFRWIGRTITKYGVKLNDIQQRLQNGIPIGKDDVLHTRFRLNGEEVTEVNGWGNFQIDGYGTWLWALSEHVRLSKNTALLKDLAQPIQITLRYLELVWKLPNYDCWEEYPEYLHPYSLGSVFAAFDSIASLIDEGLMDEPGVKVRDLAIQVKEFILNNAVYNNCLVKHIQPESSSEPPKPVLLNGIDASLIAMSVPYNLLPIDNPIILKTMQTIESDLHRNSGGVYRYKSDVYYGGGEWILLTAWLGWYYTQNGKLEQANALKEWIESQVEPDGSLAEQVSDHLLAPDHYQPWLNQWGPVASPLLWSHAMYIILVNAIEKAN